MSTKKATPVTTETTPAAKPAATDINAAMAAAAISAKDLDAKLKAAESAKVESFIQRAPVTDFYSPTKVGQELRGVYLASGKDGRNTVHVIAARGADGKIGNVKLKGTHTLSAGLRKGKAGDAVLITYQGVETGTDGRTNAKYDVGFLE